MLKKRLTAFAVVVMLFALSGCDIAFGSTDQLLQPPKLSEEQNNIYNALKAVTNENISMVYPRTGEYRSSFILYDLDGIDGDEAIAFYRESSSSSNIWINVLVQEEGNWVSKVDDNVSNVTEVEKVSFVEEEGNVYIIIGFNTSNADEKRVMIYRYKDRQLSSIGDTGWTDGDEGRCINYEVYDLNNDGMAELIMFKSAISEDERREITAHMYCVDDDALIEISGKGGAKMDGDITSYANIYSGMLNSVTPALFIDTVKGGETYGTEILIARGNGLHNLILGNDLQEETERLQGISIRDFSGNGIYYIPQRKVFPGYADSEKQLYLLDWYQFDNRTGEMVKRLTTYTNYSLGYELIIPEKWDDAVTAKRYTNRDETVFYVSHNDNLEDESETLLKVRVFNKRSVLETDQGLPFGYSELEQSGQYIYAYQFSSANPDYDIDEEVLRSMFRLLAE